MTVLDYAALIIIALIGLAALLSHHKVQIMAHASDLVQKVSDAHAEIVAQVADAHEAIAKEVVKIEAATATVKAAVAEVKKDVTGQ